MIDWLRPAIMEGVISRKDQYKAQHPSPEHIRVYDLGKIGQLRVGFVRKVGKSKLTKCDC